MNNLQLDLLIDLSLAGQYGLNPETLLADLRRGRHRELTLPGLEAAARDLADRRLVASFDSALRDRRWRITALGTAALQEEGIA